MRPLFLGEAPSPSTDGRAGAAPLVGETGRRLALWAGLSPADFRVRARCLNLFDRLPQRWSQTAARREAEWLWACLTQDREEVLATYGMHLTDLREDTSMVVLLGNRVTRAFGLTHLPLFRVTQTGGPPVATMPHPSGLNRYWNEPAHVAEAERFLREMMRVGGRLPEQMELLSRAV
jgi:uracil-DNA glycosylase